MRLHCPNLTANPIVMLCTLIAEGARWEARAAQSGALQGGGSTRLVTPDTREEGLVDGFTLDPQDWERVSPCRRGEGGPAEARTSGRERSAALGTLSGTNSCAVFYGVMQLFCSQII